MKILYFHSEQQSDNSLLVWCQTKAWKKVYPCVDSETFEDKTILISV